tara:strand:- start:243 stop:443 length:201 start_codon:yes stop_codon:yes gene_type:complete
MKIEKTNLFATFETPEELHEYFNSFTGKGETFLLTFGAALMWNTIAHMQKNCKITPSIFEQRVERK